MGSIKEMATWLGTAVGPLVALLLVSAAGAAEPHVESLSFILTQPF